MNASVTAPVHPRRRWRPTLHAGRWARLRQRRELARQLPAAVESLAAALGAGAGLLPALQAMALRARGPLAATLAPLLEVQSEGPALDQALLALRDRAGGVELTLLAHAVALAGGCAEPRAAVFRRLARRLRARDESELKFAALRTRARCWAVAAAALPLATLAWLLQLEPAAVRTLLAQPHGWYLLVLSALLVLQGLALLARAVRIDDPEG